MPDSGTMQGRFARIQGARHYKAGDLSRMRIAMGLDGREAKSLASGIYFLRG
jgi:hypothetical protein